MAIPFHLLHGALWMRIGSSLLQWIESRWHNPQVWWLPGPPGPPCPFTPLEIAAYGAKSIDTRTVSGWYGSPSKPTEVEGPELDYPSLVPQ